MKDWNPGSYRNEITTWQSGTWGIVDCVAMPPTVSASSIWAKMSDCYVQMPTLGTSIWVQPGHCFGISVTLTNANTLSKVKQLGRTRDIFWGRTRQINAFGMNLLKLVIQSSTRNSILRFMGRSNLVQPPLSFGLIQFSTMSGMKLLSFLSQFILWQQRVVKNNVQRKLSHKCSTLGFETLLLQLLSSIKNFTCGQDWRIEG